MKICMRDDVYIIYISNDYEGSIDFQDKNELEKYFRKLFFKLKKYYNIELMGYYEISVYYNKFYGAIITLEKEEYEYYDYCEDKLDMRISVMTNTEFLYKLEDIKHDFFDSYSIYHYLDHYYLKLDKRLSSIEMGRLLEHSTIIYDKKAEDVLSFGKLLSKKSIVI